VRVVRGILLALLASLLAGFVIGTVIRLRLERPEHYFIGFAGASAAGMPGDVGHLGAPVLDARHYEEQIG
jgi:hypothetical protein